MDEIGSSSSPRSALLRHKPLEHPDSIRLFTMKEAEEDEPVVCELFHARLKDVPFKALSYAWNDPETDLILWNRKHADKHWTTVSLHYKKENLTGSSENLGEDVVTQLGVGMNLQAALRRMRSRYPTIPFWVDFICINQSDLEEKNQQVAMMGEIYRSAAQMCVWLGEETDTDHIAFGLVKGLHQQLEALPVSPAPVDENDIVDAFILKHGLDLSDSSQQSQAWRSVGRLFSRAWFSRIWCVQEICLAVSPDKSEPVICCGSSELDLEYFGNFCLSLFAADTKRPIRASTSFLRHMLMIRNARAAVIHARQVEEGAEPFRFYQQMLQLVRLITGFSDWNGSTRVDRIFALLGLANDVRDKQGELMFRPDYRKSASQINLELTKFFIQRDGNLEALSYLIAHESGAEAQVASWVPDWMNDGYVSRSFGERNSNYSLPRFQAAGKLCSTGQAIADAECLSCDAVMIDQIYLLLDPLIVLEDSVTDEFCNRIMENWKTIAEETRHYNATHKDLVQAYWRILTADVTPELDHWSKHFSSFKQSASSNQMVLTQLPDTCERDSMEHHKFGELLSYLHWDRAPFLTKTGRLGLAPASTQTGDSVYILQGACTPFVLRQSRHGDAKTDVLSFEVVGEAYVDGVMYGELFNGSQGEWPELQRITLV